MADAPLMVQIKWGVNPFRGDDFEEGWLPAAEAVLDYGATSWALYRSKDGMLDFVQEAVFPSKTDFERYWYSPEISLAREQLSGYYQVPLLPTFWIVAGSGALTPVAD
jgi:hypothetical protein